MNKLFSDELERVLPEDAHERLSGRLTVSLTHGRSMKNVLVDEFDSRADLIDAVVCSCFIPGFSAYEVPTYKVSSDCTGRSMIWQDCCSTRTGRYLGKVVGRVRGFKVFFRDFHSCTAASLLPKQARGTPRKLFTKPLT